MQRSDIARMRLVSQQIEAVKAASVKEVVGWMGGMQAQDYGMAKWAIGLRLPGSTEQTIETAINDGDIIRTHVFRPTWHFVSSEDIYWILELTAPNIKASLKSRHKQLELSDSIFAESNSIIERALEGGKYLTRDELLVELGKARLVLTENRASHLFLQAELDGIICNGKPAGGKQTYALLEGRVPRPKHLDQEEALGRLAKKYFSSRGPATVKDFIWWSGLSAGQAKLALDLARADLSSEIIDSQIYWFGSANAETRADQKLVHILPAYDEFLISYADRRASLPFPDQKKTISNNGIFWPIIVVDGQVVGVWKRHEKNRTVFVELSFFEGLGSSTKNKFEEAVFRYGQFLREKIEITSS